MPVCPSDEHVKKRTINNILQLLRQAAERSDEREEGKREVKARWQG